MYRAVVLGKKVYVHDALSVCTSRVSQYQFIADRFCSEIEVYRAMDAETSAAIGKRLLNLLAEIDGLELERQRGPL